ncbi:beta-microseminoprotein-like [Pelodytes ibericus]
MTGQQQSHPTNGQDLYFSEDIFNDDDVCHVVLLYSQEYGLGIVLALCMIALCNAQCVIDKTGFLRHVPRGHKAYVKHGNGCLKDGDFYHIGAEWISKDCSKCTCHLDSMICCKILAIPTDYDHDICETFLDMKACQYKAVKKLDKTQPCKVNAWIS